MSRSHASALTAVLLLAAAAACAQPFYVRGTHFAGSGDIWDALPENQLHDDGLHDDGAAGDGVYGVWIVSDQPYGYHEWKIATEDWSLNYPLDMAYPLQNAKLFTTMAGESIHFRFDTNAVGDGWQPAANAVACSHFAPPGSEYEVIGSAAEIGAWDWGVPATFSAGIWSVDVAIAEPGLHRFKFRVLGDWDIASIGYHYNLVPGDDFVFEQLAPDRTWRFEFDTVTGRGRAVDVTIVPNATATWGGVKVLFRD